MSSRYPPPSGYEPDDNDSDYGENERVAPYRATASDPIFGLLLAGAISIGLTPLVGNDSADMRYTLAWGILAAFGVLAWLLGSASRVGPETPENLSWGIVLGLIVGIPVLAFGVGTLTDVTQSMFPDMKDGELLAYLVFVMPLAETLFFRGLLQESRPFLVTGGIATVWGLVLFFPLVNRSYFPIVVGVVLLMSNLMYSYARERNGLAAAWLCQVVVNLLIFFIPFANG
jgi:hypothetical protein